MSSVELSKRTSQTGRHEARSRAARRFRGRPRESVLRESRLAARHRHRRGRFPWCADDAAQLRASIIFGKGSDPTPGSLILAVDDIDAARDDLVARGVAVSEVFHYMAAVKQHRGEST